MSLILAFKAFWKALKNPKQAQDFLDDTLPPPPPSSPPATEASHIRLLGYLQQNGRLIDFLKEDITGYNDAQVGAAVRKIHQDCAKCIEDLVTIRPVMEEGEGAAVRVQKGYDPNSIKVIGNVSGEPPFNGILVHKGWKAHKNSLPKQTNQKPSEVISPAEVEVR